MLTGCEHKDFSYAFDTVTYQVFILKQPVSTDSTKKEMLNVFLFLLRLYLT